MFTRNCKFVPAVSIIPYSIELYRWAAVGLMNGTTVDSVALPSFKAHAHDGP